MASSNPTTAGPELQMEEGSIVCLTWSYDVVGLASLFLLD